MKENGGSEVTQFQLKTYFKKRKKFRRKDKTKRKGERNMWRQVR